MKNFSIIVAADEKNWIWKGNDLAWEIPSEMKFFTKTTKTCEEWKQNAVVMWRKTWESIPEKYRPLPGRKNFVLSSNNFSEDVKIFSDFEKILEKISEDEEVGEIFVMWWWQIYSHVINHKNCSKIYFTKVLWDFDCDSFFPEIPEDFKIENESEIFEENWIKFQFLEFIR